MLDTGAAGGAAIRGGALLTSSYVGGLLLALVSAPLLVRHLGVVDFGRYVLANTLVALVVGFTEAGLTAVTQREYVVREGEARVALFRDVLGLRLVLTVLSVALATGFAALAGYDDVLILGTFLAGAGLLTVVVQNLLTIPLTAGLRFGWVTTVELVRQGANVALIVALVVAGATLLPFLSVTIATGLLALVLTTVLVRRLVPLRPSFHASEWWALAKDAIPFVAATAIFAVYFRISVVLMSLVSSELETGYFATSYRIVEIFLMVPGLLVGALFPVIARAARDDEARLAYAVRRIFEVAVILGAGFALCIALGAETIIDLVAGDEGGPSVPVLRIQGLAIVATFLAIGCGYPLLSLRRHRALLVSNTVALAASVVLTLVLGSAYGAQGAAIATVAAELALALSTAVLLVRARGGLRLPLGVLPPVAVALAVAASVTLVPGLPDAAAAVVAGAVYFGVLLALGRVPRELLEALRARPRAEGPESAPLTP